MQRVSIGSLSIRVSITIVALVVVGATLGVFWRALNCEFLNYDDEAYITDNPHVQHGLTWSSVKWAFTTTRAGNWHPVTWISHMVDVEMYGLKPRGHHLTSVLIHAGNALLVLLLFLRASGSIYRSTFIALMFALHPLHVESVAWVAERKDVLSTFFGLLALLAYVCYAESDVKSLGLRRLFFVVTVLSYALSLMCKPMLVTLPLVMLLMDYWPLQRLQRIADRPRKPGERQRTAGKNLSSLILEKLPLIALAGGSCIITLVAQYRGGAMASLASYSIGIRISNGIVSYGKYIAKTLWPYPLSVIYPHPGTSLDVYYIVGVAIFLIATTGFVLWVRKTRPYAVVGWFWYVGTLLPVIGIVQVGRQGMADRYMYFPILGLSMMIAWGVPELMYSLATRSDRRQSLGAVLVLSSVMWVVTLGIMSFCQIGCWRNSITLFQHAIRHTRDNYLAHSNLGVALLNENDTEGAIKHFATACRIRPDFAPAHAGLGTTLMRVGRLEEAALHLRLSLRLDPRLEDAQNNLGVLLVAQGRAREAVRHYASALRVSPESANLHHNMALALVALGKHNDAILHFRRASQLAPDDVDIRFNLATALLRQGRLDEAGREYRTALRLSPGHAAAHAGLAAVLYSKGLYDEAAEQVRLCRRYGGVPGAALVKSLSNRGLRCE